MWHQISHVLDELDGCLSLEKGFESGLAQHSFRGNLA